MRTKLLTLARNFYLVHDAIGYPGVNVYDGVVELIVGIENDEETQFTCERDTEVELLDNGKFVITIEDEDEPDANPTQYTCIAYKRVDWNTDLKPGA